MKKTKLLVVDDHQMIIDGIKLLLEKNDELEVFGATDENKTMALLEDETPELVLLDIEFTNTLLNTQKTKRAPLNGIDIAKSIKSLYPKVKILMLTMHNDPSFVNDSVTENDVAGYLLKNISHLELMTAIQTVLNGGKYYSPEVMKTMSDYMKSKSREDFKLTLTPREIEILSCLADDLSAKEIASKLFITVNTVNAHKQNLIDKLDVNSSLGLVRYAVENGYTNPKL